MEAQTRLEASRWALPSAPGRPVSPLGLCSSGTSQGSPHPPPHPLPLALLCSHWCMLESRVHVARGPPAQRASEGFVSPHTSERRLPGSPWAAPSRRSPGGSGAPAAVAAGRGWLLSHSCCWPDAISLPAQPAAGPLSSL